MTELMKLKAEILRGNNNDNNNNNNNNAQQCLIFNDFYVKSLSFLYKFSERVSLKTIINFIEVIIIHSSLLLLENGIIEE
jgi:hypothetical protein